MKKNYLGLLASTVLFISGQPAFGADYHLVINNQQQGPVSLEQLQQMVNNGTVTKDTLVWQNGMPSWDKAETQQELQNLFSVISPPPFISTISPIPPPPPPSILLTQPTAIDTAQNDEDLNSLADAKAITNASDDMDDWFDSALQQFNFSQYGENNGKFILNASQSVSLKPTDPQYGDALVNAFDKAMMKVQEKYLMIRFGNIVVDKVKSRYSDRSTHAKEIELPAIEDVGFSEKILNILDKGLDVTEKKLDQELLELGVDQSEINKLTPTKKKDVFRDKFIKNTIQQASGEIAGLFPLQTNVTKDSSGRTVLGIIAIASPKTLQIAKDISLQRNSLIKGKGRNIESLLPTENKDFISTLGVRLAYAEDGTPAIISYGIASYRPDTGDDYINDELKAGAKNSAVANADAQIAEIINGRMNAKKQEKQGEDINKYVEREMRTDSDTVEKTITNIAYLQLKHGGIQLARDKNLLEQ